MGYETRIHVVAEYPFDLGDEVPMGQELAMIDLSKCGYDGPLEKLMERYRGKKKGGKPTFALYANNPERQYEAVKILRELAHQATEPEGEGNIEERTARANYLTELSNHIEDGTITTDRYGDYLGVIPIDEFIDALEDELKGEEPYRRFAWALALLKSIRATWTDGRLKVVTYGH